MKFPEVLMFLIVKIYFVFMLYNRYVKMALHKQGIFFHVYFSLLYLVSIS